MAQQQDEKHNRDKKEAQFEGILDVNALAGELIQILSRTLPKKITINKIVREPGSIPLDRNQIRQALLNICLNARDAMPHGGTLEIAIDARDVASSLVLEPGRYCEIRIADSGAGMPPDVLNRLFEPFFTTKGVGRGTGLGLSTSHGIVRNLGGDIEVYMYSEPGRGTVFTVLLPTGNAAQACEKEAAPEPAIAGTETLLVVDDEPQMLRLAEKGLSRLGYEVLTADTGPHALEILARHRDRIRAVILDMVMPEMDGAEVFGAIRKIDPQLAVIIASGFSADGRAEDLMSQGAHSFIQKPFVINELARTLRRVLDT